MTEEEFKNIKIGDILERFTSKTISGKDSQNNDYESFLCKVTKITTNGDIVYQVIKSKCDIDIIELSNKYSGTDIRWCANYMISSKLKLKDFLD